MSHNTNGKSPSERRSLRRNLSELLHDAATIAEMQLKLLALDASSCVEKARTPLVVAVLGGLLAAAAATVGLFAAAEILVETAAWPRWAACLLAAGVAALLAAVLVVAAGRRLGKALSPLDRSRSEFQENVRWIRQAIKAHGRDADDGGESQRGRPQRGRRAAHQGLPGKNHPGDEP